METIIKGTVGGGRRLGRKLGFPTANVEGADLAHVPDGVYAAEAEVDGVRCRGMASIGPKPTVDNNPARVLEIHLFGFGRDIYGREITVRLCRRIRGIEKFPSLEALRDAIAADREKVMAYFRERG